MFPNTPHCELAVLFERIEAEVPEQAIVVEPAEPEAVAETVVDILPDIADDGEEVV